MPTPNSGEQRDEFLKRCMGDKEAINSFPKENQRYAFCNSQWDNKDKNMETENSFKDFQTEFKDIDSKKGIVAGYFADFESLDSDGDVIKKGAFNRTINDNGPASARPRIKHLFNHDVNSPLGVLLTLKEDNKGLYYESKVGKHNLGQDFIKMAESGLITEHSIGYRTIRQNKVREDYKEGEVMRELTEVRLFEGSSLSGWGANENTPLTGIKSIDAAIERSKQIEKFCRESDATDSTIEALLLYNKELLQIIATTQPADPAIVPEQEVVIVDEVEEKQMPSTVECPSCFKHTYNTQATKEFIRCHRCGAVFTYGSKLFIKL